MELVAIDHAGNELKGLEVVQRQPWLLDVWEPLKTKAPNPCICQPYCCYSRTVIFYVRPYVVRPFHGIVNWRGKYEASKPGSEFEKWDEVEHELTWDWPIQFNGEVFLCGGGTAIWRGGRGWWMKYWARRKKVN